MAPGPKNAIMGDVTDDPMEIPGTIVDENALVDERKMAKYSKTAEFKRLREFMEARVKFYQRYLPNGSQVEGDPKTDGPLSVNLPVGVTDVTPYWIAGCIITREFENVLAEYVAAAEAVSESDTK